MSTKFGLKEAIKVLREQNYIVETHHSGKYIVRYPTESPIRSQPVNVKQHEESEEGYCLYTERELIKHAKIYFKQEFRSISKRKQLYKEDCKRKSRAKSKRKIHNEEFDDLDIKQDIHKISTHYYW